MHEPKHAAQQAEFVYYATPNKAAEKLLAKEFLANTGFDPVFGARPLKRTIQHLVQDPLAMKILDGSIKEGDHITVDTRDGELVFQ